MATKKKSASVNQLVNVGPGVMVLVFHGICEREDCGGSTLCTQTIRDDEVVKEFKPRFCERHDFFARRFA